MDRLVILYSNEVNPQLTVNTLDELEISLPPSTSGTSVAFTKNGVTYSVSYADTDQSETSSISAAAEMQSLSCLLPSQSRNGQLYPGQCLGPHSETHCHPNDIAAPKPFSRKIVIAESPIDPTSIPQLLSNVGDDANERFPLGRSKRPFQPTHLLKHSFQPIGAGVAITARLPSVVEGPPVDVDGRDTARPAKKSKRKRHEKDLSSVADPAEPSPQEGKVKSKRMKVDGV